MHSRNYTNFLDVCRSILDEVVDRKIDYSALNNKIVVTDNLHVTQLLEFADQGISIKGLVLISGSRNSHLAIVIKSLGIPSITGVDIPISFSSDNCYAILDSRVGFENIILNPSDEVKTFYLAILEKSMSDSKRLDYFRDKEAITKNNEKVNLGASLVSTTKLEKIEGIYFDELGLMRTEFLFAGRDIFPNQDEQLEVLKSVLPYFEGKCVNIRLFDLGSEKYLYNLPISQLDESSLGIRGTRFLLNNTNLLKSQLKAILRFSYFINVTVVYPFVTNLSEIIQMNKILEKCKEELASDNFKFDEEIKVGCLIETPASAVMSDQIIDLVDKVMLGVNDLTQHTLACSRFNINLEYMYDFFDSSVFRLIKKTLDNANDKGKSAIVCGEICNSEIGVAALLILGARSIATSWNYSSKIKKLISKIDLTNTEEIRNYIINSGSAETNKSIISMFLNDMP